MAYYRRRAAEYEAIYSWPERQADLARLREKIPAVLRGALANMTPADLYRAWYEQARGRT